MPRDGIWRRVLWNALLFSAIATWHERVAAQALDRLQTDWADLARYRADNAALGLPGTGERRVVFMGNSITEGWAKHFATMFPGKPYVGRGISGQTTPQMLVRFRQDVIALKPAVVVILAGTNDIAGNTGPSTVEMIADNLAAMTELAQANGIQVVLSSVLPVYDYPWKRGLEPAPKIVALNTWMKQYAATHGAVYLDYHSAMADERQGMKADLAYDGVHPNEAGYRVMARLVEPAIAEALRRASKTGVTYRSPGGTTLRLLLDDSNVGPEAAVGELTFLPNADSGDHQHGAIEMFYVLSGELEHVVNGKSEILRPGRTGHVRPPDKVRHKTGPAGAKVIVIWVPGEEAKRIVARWTKEP